MQYAVKDDRARVISIFVANSLGHAVETKHFLERACSKEHGVDFIFTVAPATRKDAKLWEDALMSGIMGDLS